MTSLHFSTGPDDPRLYEVDDDFRQLLADLSPLIAASRMQRARVFHRTATAAGGTLRILDQPDLPAHGFFRPGRAFEVVARYSNGIESDDIAPAIRGITLRLLDPAGSGDAGLLDLSLITGDRFFGRNADAFRRYSSGDAQRAALVQEYPELRDTVWSMYRHATSYADYHYHSQVPGGFLGDDGRQWLVRYRLVPAHRAADSAPFEPGELWLPPAPPGELTRVAAADPRPRTYLHDELRTRVRTGAVAAVLQLQLHPVTGSAAENDAALDCTRTWPEHRYPWRDVATLRLDTILDNAAVEDLGFNPSSAPAGLGTALASSPYENASTGHLRALIYRLTSAARRGEELPAELAELVRPRRSSAAAAQGCPFSGQAAEKSGHPAEKSGVEPAPARRTVVVVGAGPAGLSTARELERAGHRAVVLESLPEVGGKCESVDIDDRAYDLGGHVCTTQYENVARLAVELGVETEDTTPHRVYDIDQAESVPQSAAFFQRESFSRYAALREARFPRIAEAGLAHSAPALAQPVSEWLAEHGLESMAESLGTGYTAAGYGHLAGDLPALYFVKYAEMTGLLSARPELLGHPGSFTIVGGFKRLWEKVAAGLGDVRCGVTITAIERDPDQATGGVLVHTDQGQVVADDLVLTVPIDQVLPVLDASADELDLAGRVRHLDYYTTVVSATGLPRSAFYLVDEYTRAGAELGHAVAFHHRYPDRDVYACYSYGAEGLDGPDIVERLGELVARMGGVLGEVHTQRRWRFLPHFGSDDLRAGVYERIEHQQGRLHTYHVGSLPAYELVECNVAYARELVRQHFGGESGGDVPGRVAQVPRPVRPAPTVDALRDWLMDHVAAELQLPPEALSPDARLDSLALESISVAALQAGLSDWLGYRIPHTLFLEQPTIEAIARQLAVGQTALPEQAATAPAGGEVATAATHPSTLLLGLTAARPFFCVGGAVGAAYYLLPLARDIGAARPFYGVRAPGYDGAEEPLDTVEELAARYIESVRLLQPYGPYLLGGHSFGGVVAYEMGRQLRQAGEEVTRVVLLDTYVPVPDQPLPPVDDAAAIRELMTMNRLAFASGGPAGVEIDPSLAISEQKERLGRFLGANGSLPVEEHISNMLRVYQANIEANVKYQPPPSDLRVTLIKATGGFPPVMEPDRNTALKLDAPANGWEYVDLGELEVVPIPGDHFTMFVEPNDELLASAVHRCLAEEERHSANTLTGAAPQRQGSVATTIAFNPLDPAFINDPFPFYRALRETAPIHYEDSLGGWVFTRYEEVSQLLRHHGVVRPPVTDYLFASVPQADREEMSEFERMLGEMLPFTNPPYHTRLRKLVSKAFTPRTVEAMRPRIQQITDELLDGIEAAGGGELISQVAYPLPAAVVMEFIGVPAADHPRMTYLAQQLMALLGAQYAADAPVIARAAHAAMQEFTTYLTGLIAQRRREPREDLLSALIATDGGPDGALTDEELILNCMALLNAGLETTANYLGNGTYALLRNPDQFELLRDNPALAEYAAEELLRYDGPTPILTPQLADEDVEIGGKLIKKGQLLYPVIGAANRDPARFPDGERLDVSRKPNGQLSFGFGIHFCIGAALARIEGQVLFQTLARRFPTLRVDGGAVPPAFRDDPVLRGLTSLHVRTA